MRSKKLIRIALAGAVSLALLCGIFSGVSLAVGSEDFSDMGTSHPYYDAVDSLRDRGVVEGYEVDDARQYRPDIEINRAEFLKIVMESAEIMAEGENCYPDVKGEWFAPYVCKATAEGIVKGYDDGNFKPWQKINFAEAAKIIANVLELSMDEENPNLWFESYVLALEDYAAIPPSISGFNQDVNRGEMAEMIYRIQSKVTDKDYNTFEGLSKGEKDQSQFGNLERVRSCAALGAYLDERSYHSDYDYYRGDFADDTVSSPAAESQKTAGVEQNGGVGDDFSQTNVQVQGVDEADIVKTDGQYIYVLKGETVRIVDARDPANLEEVDEISFMGEGFYPTDMYVGGARLVVLGDYYGPMIYPYGSDEIVAKRVISYGGAVVKIFVFDISDKMNIEKIRETEVEGYYQSSRKVDDMVYVVANKYKYYYPMPVPYAEDLLPLYRDSAEGAEVAPIVGCTDVGFMPGPREDLSYLVVLGIDVADPDADLVKSVILGSGYEVYSSRENMYVSSSLYDFWWGGGEEETIIHKFGLAADEISYEGKGKVPGTILNQFSMDEHKGNFRIATTRGNMWDESSTNNVYILDSDMELIGQLEGLAPGESIYSARFMGDRGYLVTFKKIDPFFVIDLSDARAPKVLGKLKIPGYSDYLHPFDENHIIGVGKDTLEAEIDLIESRGLDFVWYQGMKIAMFDVTDVENPIELHKVIIGDRGTESELLYNHKALLFDKAKGLMAFPVTVYEIPEEVKNDPDAAGYTYGDPVFQGAYVYDVSIANGFDLRGTISHYEEDEIAKKAGYYWFGDKDIKRILYIGNYFYTVSQTVVKSSRMSNLSDVDTVELGGDSEGVYYW